MRRARKLLKRKEKKGKKMKGLLVYSLESNFFAKKRLGVLTKYKEKQRGNNFFSLKPSKMSEKSEEKGLVFGYEAFTMEIERRARG